MHQSAVHLSKVSAGLTQELVIRGESKQGRYSVTMHALESIQLMQVMVQASHCPHNIPGEPFYNAHARTG